VRPLAAVLLPALIAGALIACAPPARAQLITLPSRPDPAATADEPTPDQRTLEGRIAGLLIAGQYDDIDRLADKARREKTRLTGGAWRLRHIYTGLAPREKSESAMNNTITRLNLWIAARPDSITPRVALAAAYHDYAWMARGNGYANTVSAEAWKLFDARIAEAHRALDDAASLKQTCPQWYSEMQTVALAEGWDNAKTADLFDKAVKYEPEYYYFYRSYAHYLLPKWEGKFGDSAAFAKKSADALAGQQGDFLYFEIATEILGTETSDANVKPSELDWPRLQRGYDALTQLYGSTNTDLNQFARMAYRYHDAEAAKRLFAQIGEKWSHNVWKTQTRYNKARKWALGPIDIGNPGLRTLPSPATP
jgi:Domain of unknown function (DUF4034)